MREGAQESVKGGDRGKRGYVRDDKRGCVCEGIRGYITEYELMRGCVMGVDRSVLAYKSVYYPQPKRHAASV